VSSASVRVHPTGNGARRSVRRVLVTVAGGPVLAGYAVALALAAWTAAGVEFGSICQEGVCSSSALGWS